MRNRSCDFNMIKTLGITAALGLTSLLGGCNKEEPKIERPFPTNIAVFEDFAYKGTLTDRNRDGKFDILKLDRKVAYNDEPKHKVFATYIARSPETIEGVEFHLVDQKFFDQYEPMRTPFNPSQDYVKN